MSDPPSPNRSRAYVAGVLAAGLAIAALVVVLAGSGGEGEAAAADPECIEGWNGDRSMVAFGQHQFGGHGYERVQVLRVSETGWPTEAGDGLCAVVFAARALDPEPGARAQVRRDGEWTGFESLRGVDEDRIAQLQADASSAVNASLSADGTLQTASG